MKRTTALVFLAGLAHTLRAPSTCMLSPLVTIKAGDKLITGVENTISGPCELTLLFSDDDFLPVTFTFEPIACSAFQEAEISTPLEVPTGPATFLLQCAGQQATGCIKASLEGGSADFHALNVQQKGKVSCLMPTATSTSLSTITQQSKTIISSVITTKFATEVDTTSLFSSLQSSGITPLGSGHISKPGSTTWQDASATASGISTLSKSSVTAKSSSTATANTESPDGVTSSSSTSVTTSVPTSNIDSSIFNTISPSSVNSGTSSIASITIVTEQTPPRAPACTMEHQGS
ncbi:hypothetical protein EAF04_001367 [Stromatinia cepivora]|nr:hypothetical protein EAF04_001367 [Stromatinia cepivora]